jgi:phage FluMu protein Com
MVTFSVKCKCGVILYRGKKEPAYSTIACPKCKAVLKINKSPKSVPAGPPVQLAPADASKQPAPYVANVGDAMRTKA